MRERRSKTRALWITMGAGLTVTLIATLAACDQAPGGGHASNRIRPPSWIQGHWVCAQHAIQRCGKAQQDGLVFGTSFVLMMMA